MIVHRVFPHDRGARRGQRGGALWFPRSLQGTGRHDNPERYGCVYVSESELSVVAEALAPFRGSGDLQPHMLERSGQTLALAAIELSDDAEILDLDDPAVLKRESLRPSAVATRRREITQAQAGALYDRRPRAVGLRWWSTLEASWLNLTLFGRARSRLRLADLRALGVDDQMVRTAAETLGLGTAGP